MKFKLFSTEIYVSFFFSALICLMLLFDRTGYIMPLFLAVFLHETGHLAAMFLLDCAPKKIRLIPAAVEIITDFKTEKRELLVALAGPAVNLFVFLVVYFNYLAFKNEDFLTFSLINLLIALFNLLPLSGLDGGTILFFLLSRRLSASRSFLIMKIVALIFAAVSLFFGVTLLFRGSFNPSFFIIALYLIVVNLIKM